MQIQTTEYKESQQEPFPEYWGHSKRYSVNRAFVLFVDYQETIHTNCLLLWQEMCDLKFEPGV